ncbi:MAG: zinc-binding dehydrogenase [Clostridia bacterium]|nr:zinc-binding dehydrogenase [Clostridia bacterium]
MLSRRAYLKTPGNFVIEERELIPNDDQVLVKIKICGLCNWELNFWKGNGPEDGLYRTYPYVLGHEWSGVVEEVGADVTHVKKGDKVCGLVNNEFGGFSEYAVPYADEVFKLSDDTDFDNAIAEPMKCIATVIRLSTPTIGDTGLVVGCGPMGLWCTQALKSNTLGNLIAVDVDDKKLELAKSYGATHTINPLKEDAVARISEITNGKMCDFVIEGTGNGKLISTTFDYLKKCGKLILMSSYETPLDGFDLPKLIGKCIKIIPAHPPAQEAEDIYRAIALINNGTFHNEDIITHRFSLDQINEAFKTLENKPKDYIKGIIEFK